jgi:RNA polymerase sigma-70 factor (ECF subfamily)
MNQTVSVNDEFVQAFHQHYAGMCRFVRRYVGSDAAAEDVVQDVWATLWQRGVDANRLAKAYLYTAARNRALHVVEHQAVEGRHTESVQAEPVTSPAADAAELDEMTIAAQRAVEALPDRCRAIYRMVRNDGLSYAEVAELLGISVSTVEVQMWRALKKLRIAMAPFFILVTIFGHTREKDAMSTGLSTPVKVERTCPVLIT